MNLCAYLRTLTQQRRAPASMANPFFRANKSLLQEQVFKIQFATTNKGMKHISTLRQTFTFLIVNLKRETTFLSGGRNGGLTVPKNVRSRGVLHERRFRNPAVNINRSLSLSGLEAKINPV